VSFSKVVTMLDFDVEPQNSISLSHVGYVAEVKENDVADFEYQYDVDVI
jgi:hypothetical protein